MEQLSRLSRTPEPFQNNVEAILQNSVQLFLKTGMPELAERWEKILVNYRKAKYH